MLNSNIPSQLDNGKKIFAWLFFPGLPIYFSFYKYIKSLYHCKVEIGIGIGIDGNIGKTIKK